MKTFILLLVTILSTSVLAETSTGRNLNPAFDFDAGFSLVSIQRFEHPSQTSDYGLKLGATHFDGGSNYVSVDFQAAKFTSDVEIDFQLAHIGYNRSYEMYVYIPFVLKPGFGLFKLESNSDNGLYRSYESGHYFEIKAETNLLKEKLSLGLYGRIYDIDYADSWFNKEKMGATFTYEFANNFSILFEYESTVSSDTVLLGVRFKY